MKEEKEVIPKDAYIAYTDGSYDKQTKKSGYGIVILQNDKVIKKLSGHLEEDFYNSHNILGEVYGVLRCIEFCLKSNIKKIYIYHDYQGLSS
jgi:ribonuclease HI